MKLKETASRKGSQLNEDGSVPKLGCLKIISQLKRTSSFVHFPFDLGSMSDESERSADDGGLEERRTKRRDQTQDVSNTVG